MAPPDAYVRASTAKLVPPTPTESTPSWSPSNIAKSIAMLDQARAEDYREGLPQKVDMEYVRVGVSVLPVVGAPIDLGVSIVQGDKVGIALGILSVIPFGGLAKLGRLGKLAEAGEHAGATLARGGEEMVTLYHGTSASRAARIVKRGFRAGADGAVYFAEDFATAEHFAESAQFATGARSATVIRLHMPKSIAANFERGTLGAFRGAPAIDILGGTGFERILFKDSISSFNEAIRKGVVQVSRLRVGAF